MESYKNSRWILILHPRQTSSGLGTTFGSARPWQIKHWVLWMWEISLYNLENTYPFLMESYKKRQIINLLKRL
jgi:hypothetical protein